MIPKIIHYVWVGNAPKSDLILRCIESWKKYCPDYEIMEWGNDILQEIDNQYVKEAFEAKKWAFVSDYIRLYVLKKYGGVYLDTDSEITAPIDKFLDDDFFIGFENYKGDVYPSCSPIGAVKNHKFISEILDSYDDDKFNLGNGKLNLKTIPQRFYDYFCDKYPKKNFKDGYNTLEIEPKCKIYPYWYFLNYEENKENYAIHHFEASWIDDFNYKNIIVFPYFLGKKIIIRKYKKKRKDTITFDETEELVAKLFKNKKKEICIIKKYNCCKELYRLNKVVKLRQFKQYVIKKTNSDKHKESYNFLSFLINIVAQQIRCKLQSFKNFILRKKSKYLNIGFIIGGGIGDVVIDALYLKKFCDRMDVKYNLYLFTSQNPDNIKWITKDQFSCKIYPVSKCRDFQFDLFIRIDVQFPEVLNFNILSVGNSKFLTKYVISVCNFLIEHYNLISLEERFKQVGYGLSKGLDRISLMDIDNLLGLSKNEKLNPILIADEKKILNKFGVAKTKFVTLTRSIDQNHKSSVNENIRIWPIEYYNQIVQHIRKFNPNIKIIQLGGINTSNNRILGIDDDLSGKTSFQELLVLLKNSSLHIDGECGMVHLRHFLSAHPSVVIFGPTNEKFYGYSENINIRTLQCNLSYCEWLIGKNWQTFCLKSDSNESVCMQSVTTKMVINAIEGALR